MHILMFICACKITNKKAEREKKAEELSFLSFFCRILNGNQSNLVYLWLKSIAKMKDVGSSNGEMMRRGRVEVVCGSMFSGKTEELIRRLRRAQFAKQKVEIFKPAIDVRYSEEEVVSHEGNSILSTPVDSSASILLMGQESDVVGIDEAQFFDEHIVEVCNELAARGIRVIVAGLDLDFKGQPFGPMPQLCAIADEVTKVHAICVRCGALAYVSHRIVAGDKQVMLGEKQEYEPLCRECYAKVMEISS